jgi:hypothetical protein
MNNNKSNFEQLSQTNPDLLTRSDHEQILQSMIDEGTDEILIQKYTQSIDRIFGTTFDNESKDTREPINLPNSNRKEQRLRELFEDSKLVTNQELITHIKTKMGQLIATNILYFGGDTTPVNVAYSNLSLESKKIICQKAGLTVDFVNVTKGPQSRIGF